MILTVTLGASIDTLYLAGSLTTGEVNRVSEVRHTAGGKGMNVSRVAALCGERVTATGLVGGFHGQYFESLITEPGIRRCFTQSGKETRCCINIRDDTGRSTELLEPGAPVSAEVLAEFYSTYLLELQSADVVVISGSVPAGTPEDFYAKLITAAKDAGKPVLLDTSGAMLRPTIAALPTLIKPNSDEIRQLLGREAASRAELITAARELHESGIAIVVVSLGRDGALIVCADGAFQGKTPDIPVVNTVGCGDSMVAGFAVGLSRGYAIEEAIRLAVAVSTANALTMETGSFRQEDLDRLLGQVAVVRL